MSVDVHLDHCLQKAACEWPDSLPLFLPQPQVADGDRGQHWCIQQLEELSKHCYGTTGATNLLPGKTFNGSLFFTKYYRKIIKINQTHCSPFF